MSELSPLPPQPPMSRISIKVILFRVGAYLSPFAYAAILTKWGSSLPSWVVIAGVVIVAIVFATAAYLHFKDLGGWPRVEEYIHEHLLVCGSAIAILPCLVVGLVLYFAMRPMPLQGKKEDDKPVAQNPDTTTQNAPKNQNSAPSVSTSAPPPKKKPHSKNVPPAAPTEPSGQTTYDQDCKDSACAQGPSSSATYNKFGVPKPPPKMIIESMKALDAMTTSTPDQDRGHNHPGLAISFHPDAPFVTPMFLVRCDHPCIASMIRFADAMGTKFFGDLNGSLLSTNDRSVVVFGSGNKTLVTPDTTVIITVRSQDDEPVKSATVEGYVQ